MEKWLGVHRVRKWRNHLRDRRTKSKGICGMIAKQTEEMINVEDNNRV
nr:MAG TPA: hypothetical protein [Caudoviricetes sp.]